MKVEETKYLVLVNPWNKYPDNIDFNIIDVNSKYAENRFAEENTFKAFLKLKEYALENGYDIEIESGYRSVEHQQRVFDNCANQKGLEYAKKYVAIPGYSEHHTGLALDICLKQDDKYIIEHNLPDDFKNFLKENAYKFGFIIRYPKGKEDITGYNYEPWHIRYVGNIAEYIDKHNLTLEEYLDMFKNYHETRNLKV